MKRVRKSIATICIGLSIGATAVAFVGPVAGDTRFTGFCNRPAADNASDTARAHAGC